MATAPLIRACPECGTRFRVAPEMLDVANGQVRCGACLAIFDAREAPEEGLDVGAGIESAPEAASDAGFAPADHLLADAPVPQHQDLEQELAFTPPPSPAPFRAARQPFATQSPDAAADELPSAVPAALRADVRRPEPTPVPPAAATQLSPQARMGARAALAASALPKNTSPSGPMDAAAQTEPVPVRARRDREASPKGAGSVFLLAVALSALLVVNVFGLRLDDWSRKPEMRGLYEAACDLIGCRVPAPNAPTAWSFQPQGVARPGPPEPITLEVVLVNNAAYRQALPTVGVRFTGDGGELIAEEQLTPRDYQADRPAERLSPNKRKVLRLRFPDPGAGAAHYQIALL